LTAKSDDLIHADRHGATVIPLGVAAKLPEAMRKRPIGKTGN
jgi:hypothetical protein